MMRVVILRLQGQLSQGIQATLEWRQENSPHIEGTLQGTLPPKTDLATLYTDWQKHYLDLGSATRLEFVAESDQHLSQLRNAKKQCVQTAQQLEELMNQWLNHDSDDFQRITRQLAELYGSSKDLRLLIRTDDTELQRLPWQLWDHVQRNPQIPISLGPLEYRQAQLKSLEIPVRVLAILGSDHNIDLDHEQDILMGIPDIDLTLLKQPSRDQVARALKDEKGWDLLFFAGHSHTEDHQGVISINETDSLTLKDLHHHLSIAAHRGLQVCILNSCDGLGLAHHLSGLSIPYIVYMREPVPDQVAHKFLASFVQYFSQGNSVHNAVLSARHDLESIQDQFPYATWLPIIFQQPGVETLTWPTPSLPNKQSFSFLGFRLKYWILLALSLSAMVVSIWATNFWTDTSPQLGDFTSMGEEVLGLRPGHKRNAADAIAQKNYPQGIQNLLESWQDDGNDPETLIYLNNAILDNMNAEYRTIAVSVPFLHDANIQKLSSHKLAYRLLRGVAQAQTEANLNISDLSTQLDIPFLTPNPIGNKIGLKVVIADDFNKIKNAKERAIKLSKTPEVLGVVGHYASDMSKPTLDIYKQHQLPIISPGSTAKELAIKGDGYFFRTVPTTSVEAKSVANYLLKVINKRTVKVFYNPESPFTHSFWDDFKEIYEQAGGKVISPVVQNDPLSDLASSEFDPVGAIAALKQYGDPNDIPLLIVPDGEVSLAQDNAFKLIKENAGQHPIVGSWGLDNPKTLSVLPKPLSQSLVVSVPWHYRASPNTDFSSHAESLWGQQAKAQTALAYDATRVLIQALHAQKTPSRKGTQSILMAPDFKVWGATGKIEFDQNGNRKHPPQVLIQPKQCSSNSSEIEFVPTNKIC